MKKIFAIFLCLLLMMSLVSCDRENEAFDPQKTSYSFISKQERLSWKNKIVAVMSAGDFYEDIEVFGHLFFGMALMDMNLDGTPELIAAYAGGSMGNVCVEVFDLETGEPLRLLGSTPHYKDEDRIYLCVHRDREGNYLIVNEGCLRDGLEWYTLTSSVNEKMKLDTLFAEVASSDDCIRYYCKTDEVEKAEFEKQEDQFKKDYREITETQVKIIYWKDIDTATESGAISAMADALVNSEQEFIDFGK